MPDLRVPPQLQRLSLQTHWIRMPLLCLLLQHKIIVHLQPRKVAPLRRRTRSNWSFLSSSSACNPLADRALERMVLERMRLSGLRTRFPLRHLLNLIPMLRLPPRLPLNKKGGDQEQRGRLVESDGGLLVRIRLKVAVKVRLTVAPAPFSSMSSEVRRTRR